MPSSSASSASREELDCVLPVDIQAELTIWQQLLFYGDMTPPPEKPHDHQGVRSGSSSFSNEDSSRASSQTTDPYFPAPPGAPPQVPPETYNYLIHALLSLQGSAYPQNYPGTYPYPMQPSPNSHYNYGWPPGAAQPIPNASTAGSSLFCQTNAPIPLPPRTVSQSMAGSSQLTASPAAAPATEPTVQDPEQTEEATTTIEDKRRRNTAASARFRIKKKQKTLNIERTVADLTGRTEELEREATDLRRENAWLKEIVLLKGRSLTRGSQAPAPVSRHDKDESDDRTHAESGLETTVKRRRKEN